MIRTHRYLLFLAISLALPITWASAAESLRYRFGPDQQFAYEVEITADMPTQVETLKGVISYKATSTGDPLKVTYQGGLKKSTKTKPGKSSGRSGFGPPGFGRPGGFPFPMGMGGPFGRSSNPFMGLTTTSNDITLTPRGRVLAMKGDSQLPYLLGNLSILIFEPLPDKYEKSWTVDNGVTITEEGDDRSGFGPPIPHFGPFGPRWGNEPDKTAAGSESASFKHKSDSGKSSTYEKTYRLRSPGGEESLSIDGSGEWTFNRQMGISESFDAKYRLTVSKDNVNLTIPVSIKYSRLSDGEWGKIQKEREVAAQEQRQKLEQMTAERKAKAESPIEGDERKQVLNDLGANNLAVLGTTLKMLADKTERSDDEIAQAVKPLTKHSDPKVSEQAKSALAKFSPEFKKVDALNTAYNKFFPVKELGPAVTDQTPLPPGLILAARRHSSWYAAKVLGELSDGRIQVQFQKVPWKEDLARADLRLAPPEVEQPNVDPAQLSGKTSGPPAGQGFRTWADDSGTFTIQAKYAGIDGQNIRLVREDGKEIKVPLARLSEADRQHVEKLRLAQPTNPFEQ